MSGVILDAAAGGTGGGTMLMIGYLLFFGVIIYFLWIRPQRKEQSQKAALLSQIAVGDSVRTTGGFIGTIIDVADDMVIVEFGNNKNCRIPMVKEAIVEIEKPENAVQEAQTPAAEKKEEKGIKSLFGKLKKE